MKLFRTICISLSIVLAGAGSIIILLLSSHAHSWKALSVPTGSMKPSILPGSLVLVHSVPTSQLKIGDVITYANPLNPKMSITHRIVQTYKNGAGIEFFITKGDANKFPDSPVVSGLVQGRVAWHVPYVGRFFTFGKGILGLTLLVYIPALIIMADETKRLADYYRSIKLYRLPGFKRSAKHREPKLAITTALSVYLTAAGLVLAPQVQALLKSNTVSLINNRISVAATPPNNCNGNITSVTVTGGGGNNNVHVTNNNSQTATTGNVTNNNNTNGGSTTSGSAINRNCTSTTITINNNH